MYSTDHLHDFYVEQGSPATFAIAAAVAQAITAPATGFTACLFAWNTTAPAANRIAITFTNFTGATSILRVNANAERNVIVRCDPLVVATFSFISALAGSLGITWLRNDAVISIV